MKSLYWRALQSSEGDKTGENYWDNEETRLELEVIVVILTTCKS